MKSLIFGQHGKSSKKSHDHWELSVLQPNYVEPLQITEETSQRSARSPSDVISHMACWKPWTIEISVIFLPTPQFSSGIFPCHDHPSRTRWTLGPLQHPSPLRKHRPHLLGRGDPASMMTMVRNAPKNVMKVSGSACSSQGSGFFLSVSHKGIQISPTSASLFRR